MNKKITIIVGAGSTLSDAFKKPLRRRPPLDHGFFKSCGKLGLLDRLSLISYLKRNYGIDPTLPEQDSLERIMAIVYTDLNNPGLESKALEAFRTIIRLFNRRIAETTNPLKVTNRTNLYRIIAKQFQNGISPEDLTIVTFNQDLQIEKVLSRLQQTKSYTRKGNLFCFPKCYGFQGSHNRLSSPPKNISCFDICEEDDQGINVLKLHGSLNWFSNHNSKKVPKNAILNQKKDFNITPRLEIPVAMTLKNGNRTTYTFPLIIPPVNHKAAIIHRDLHPIWRKAEQSLSEAHKIIVFGYSCPQTDLEAANLLRRTTRLGKNPASFVIVDPNPTVFHRYVEVTNLDHLEYFRSADAYIEKG